MAVDVSVPVASLQSTNAVLDDKLRGHDWLDAARFPAMRFQSVGVVQTGPQTADIQGVLTLHGEMHPLLLRATFNGSAVSPFSGHEQLGFSLTGTLRRSEWGVDTLVPAVSDEVRLTIAASFDKRG
jgi:polyisoprenoid-binding protein YceI